MIAPTFFPKASEEIAGMIVLIEQLIACDHAYMRNGNVYFRIKSDPTYGELAHMDYAEMLATANERGNDPTDPNKIDPLDFVLWRASKPGEASWPSPWSDGRPGWHIECSTMATRYLGPQLDIHGGGRDLIFPHHPSEVAQTEPVTGVRPFVRFWMHGGLVWLDGEKMSKSRGNMVFVNEALKQHSADALRWYLLAFPYREDFSYEQAGVVALEASVARLRAAITATSAASSVGIAAGARPALDQRAAQARAAFLAALDDDLHMSLALTLLDDLGHDVLAAAEAGQPVQAAQTTLRELAGIMGFWAAEA
jgi:L-cysteine:1D-myo-inositol 2-amino-2-deoxy-alpha-D-glucopyranoside ligase